MAPNRLVYNSYGKKYKVPRILVSSLTELQRGDHIGFHRHSGAYWHYAIVERIDEAEDEIHVIEYTNTAKEFFNDNCCPPTIMDMTIAKVVRGKYKFKDEKVYLMEHESCLDPESVFSRAQSKLGERNYDLFYNNCENFAMWCKTGESSSDQVDKAKEMLLEEVAVKSSKAVLTDDEGWKKFKKWLQKSKVIEAGTNLEKQNQFILEMAKLVRLTPTSQLQVAMTPKLFVPPQMRAQLMTLFPDVQFRWEEVTNQLVAGDFLGGEVTKTALQEGSEEVLTQSVSKGNSLLSGAKFSVAVEGLFAAYDIGCAYNDMTKGKITGSECATAAAKRVVTGTGNVVGSTVGASTVGAAIGQVLNIPFPIVGGVVGSVVGGIVGGLTGKFVGNLVGNYWL